MAGKTITSASAIYMLTIPDVFNTPVQLQEFAVDEAFNTEAVDAAETQVGVDGAGVAGWVPREYPQTIQLLASSRSNDVFDQWQAAQEAIRDIIYASGIIRIPAIKLQIAMQKGVLKRWSPQPNVRRVLAPREYTIHWLPDLGQPAILTSPIG